MRVLAHEERPADFVRAAIFANRLGDREDMRFGEGVVQARAAMAARAEAHELIRIGEIGSTVVEIGLQSAHIDQELIRSGVASEVMRAAHATPTLDDTLRRVSPIRKRGEHRADEQRLN